jgi:two-component system cell cycle sensor histidine kinase/response regulator CckA
MDERICRLTSMTGDGVCHFDARTGRLIECNETLIALLGLTSSPADVRGKLLRELILARQSWEELRRPLEREGVARGVEFHYQTPRGEERWARVYAQRLAETAEGLCVVEALFRDITGEKRAIRELERERAELDVTLRSIGDGLIATDSEGRITLMNLAAESITGWTGEEATGRPLEEIFRIVDETSQEPLDNPARRVLASGQKVSLTNHTLLLTRDGRKRVIADSAAPIRFSDGSIIGAVLVFRDVTRERVMWNALRRSEARYRQLFDAMLDAFALHEIILDDQGRPCDYRFLEVNPRFEEMTGLKAKDLIGRTVLEVMPQTEPEWIETYGRVALTGEPVHFERFSAVLNRHYEVTAFRPAPGQFAVLFVDVTAARRAEDERRRMEMQIQQTQKLESLGVLAGGIAHDFNNLLTGILGNASLALLDIPEGSPAYDSLKQIERSAQRAADLCRQLLAYSGRGRLTVEPVNLSALVEEMGNLLQLSISKKAVLKYDLAQSLPAILADPTQIRQIVMNLIVNASEAIGDRSGIIAISTGAMICDAAYLRSVYLNESLAEGLYVYLEVSDTGVGMTPEIQARIFDPFFTTKFTGRGLGLSALLGIVRAHKGTVKVYSEPGRGSTFKVLFPAAAEPSPTPETPASDSPPPALKGTLLVVDDDETIRSLARRALERAGLQVLTAADGREGVELFRKFADVIDVVLLDMTMPGLNGEEAFREIRLCRPHVRVILSSGYTESEATSRFAGKGLAGFIQKPYRQSDLIAKVAEILHRSPPLQDAPSRG